MSLFNFVDPYIFSELLDICEEHFYAEGDKNPWGKKIGETYMKNTKSFVKAEDTPWLNSEKSKYKIFK